VSTGWLPHTDLKASLVSLFLKTFFFFFGGGELTGFEHLESPVVVSCYCQRSHRFPYSKHGLGLLVKQRNVPRSLVISFQMATIYKMPIEPPTFKPSANGSYSELSCPFPSKDKPSTCPGRDNNWYFDPTWVPEVLSVLINFRGRNDVTPTPATD
jgi:hypothetical protein